MDDRERAQRDLAIEARTIERLIEHAKNDDMGTGFVAWLRAMAIALPLGELDNLNLRPLHGQVIVELLGCAAEGVLQGRVFSTSSGSELKKGDRVLFSRYVSRADVGTRVVLWERDVLAAVEA